MSTPTHLMFIRICDSCGCVKSLVIGKRNRKIFVINLSNNLKFQEVTIEITKHNT